MALKVYEYKGATYQFDDSDVPAGAVEVKALAPANKSIAPENKAVGHDASKPTAARRK